MAMIKAGLTVDEELDIEQYQQDAEDPSSKEDWDEGSMEAESFDSPVTVVSTGNDRTSATP